MTLRQRVILMVSAFLVVILLVVAAIVFKTKKPAPKPTENTPQTVIDRNNIDTAIKVGTEPTQIPVTAEVKPPTTDQQEDITVKNIAKIFVERYHTYSSENNYENIKDVKSIVAPSFWTKISAPLTTPPPAPSSFVALTTRVVSILFVDVSKNTATVDLKVKKTATTNGQTTNSYGEYDVSLTKVNGEWLVSGETVK